jgi:hypothetical protein
MNVVILCHAEELKCFLALEYFLITRDMKAAACIYFESSIRTGQQQTTKPQGNYRVNVEKSPRSKFYYDHSDRGTFVVRWRQLVEQTN